MRGLKYNLF